MRSLPLLVLALVAVGCGSRVPTTPLAARAQPPRAGIATAWRGRGRFSVSAPHRRLDTEFVVRVEPGDATHPAEARLVLLADAGVQLADVSWTAAGATVHRCVPDLVERAPALARMLDPWLPAAADAQRGWHDERLLERAGERTRWYGGDPLLLRRVDGGGWPLEAADYRALGDALLAREITADGPWSAQLQLRLVEATPLPPR